MIQNVGLHTCPICKKKFVPAPYHAWRTTNKGKLVCSYHCALESDRRKAAKRKYIKRDEKGAMDK
jgi:hypothetical protein